MRPRLVPLLLALSLAPGCRREPASPPASRYDLKGKVVEVDAAASSVTLAHDAIAGFMPAMTMPFNVPGENAALLRTMAPGDSVSATLVVTHSRHWLESVVLVKAAVPAAIPAGSKPERQPQPGDPVPDVALVDQDGRPLRLAEYKGRALAVSFVFTRCPMPDFCPFLMQGFARAHTALVADPELAARTALLTVSFDVAHDTPKVLLAYGRPFQKTQPPFSHWRLATGTEPDIRVLGASMGLEFERDEGSFSHNLRTGVVGPDGRLRRLFRGNEWTADELVSAMRDALAPPSGGG